MVACLLRSQELTQKRGAVMTNSLGSINDRIWPPSLLRLALAPPFALAFSYPIDFAPSHSSSSCISSPFSFHSSFPSPSSSAFLLVSLLSRTLNFFLLYFSFFRQKIDFLKVFSFKAPFLPFYSTGGWLQIYTLHFFSIFPPSLSCFINGHCITTLY